MNVNNLQWFSGKVLTRLVAENLISYNILSDAEKLPPEHPAHRARIQYGVHPNLIFKLNSTVGSPCLNEEIAPFPVGARSAGTIIAICFAVVLLLLLIAGGIYLLLARTNKKRLQ